MTKIILAIAAIAVSATYVGYLSYAVHSVPLWLIVIATFGLAIREFVLEIRNTRTTDSQSDLHARKPG